MEAPSSSTRWMPTPEKPRLRFTRPPLHGGVATSITRSRTAAYLNQVQKKGPGPDGQLHRPIDNPRAMAREQGKALQTSSLTAGDPRSESPSETPASLNTAMISPTWSKQACSPHSVRQTLQPVLRVASLVSQKRPRSISLWKGPMANCA